MSLLKVALFTAVMDGEATGMGNYAYDLVKAFLDLGHDSDLVLIHSDASEDPIYKCAEEDFIKYVTLHNRKVYLSSRQLNDILHSRNCELLHFPAFVAFQLGLYRASVPIVVTLHDVIPLARPDLVRPIDFWPWVFALHVDKRHVSHWITDSNYSKQDIIKYLTIPPERISVTYVPPDPVFKPVEEKEGIAEYVNEHYGIDSKFIMFVGTIDRRKNVVTLVKAFTKLKKRGYTHKLLIVGRKGWKCEETLQAIERSDFREDIIVLNYVSTQDLVKLYNLADVFAFPSLYEGFGLPPLEAMACGTPVITSNATSLPEVVGDAGIMVDPYDVGGFANAIERVLCDTRVRDEFSLKGIERAKQFSWEKTAKDTWLVYETVYGNNVS